MRRTLVTTGVIVLLAATGWTAGWFVLAGQARTALNDWAALRQSSGHDAAWSSLTLSGFPFTLMARAESVRLSLDTPAGRVAGVFPTLQARVAVPRLDRVTLTLPAEQQVSLLGPVGQASHGTARLRDGQIVLTGLGAGGGRATRAMRLTTADGTLMSEEQRVTWTVLDLTVVSREEAPPPADDPHRGETGRLALHLDGLVLPPAAGPLHDAGLTRLVMEGRLLGALSSGPPPASLARWSEEGGTIEIDTLQLVFGDFTMTAAGSLALDGAMQPVGALSLSLINPDRLIDLLVRLSLMNPRDAQTVKLALAFLTRPDGNGQRRLEAPLSLQDGRVRLGPVSLLTLPRLRWVQSPSE